MGNFDIDEIHEIRKRHSEKIENLTFKELQELTQKETEQIINEYKEICAKNKSKLKIA